jgi:hypothetical protein
MNNSAVNTALKKAQYCIQDYLSLVHESPRGERYDVKLNARDVPYARLRHALWMIDHALSWDSERLEKKMRCLGCVQGIMWSGGLVTIEELHEQNHPSECAP